MKELILYHGSYTEIDKIELDLCDENRDFGKGFYLTASKNQAKSFIKTSVTKAKKKQLVSEDHNYGYVTKYRVILDENIKVYQFDGVTKDWLNYISVNRRKALSEKLLPLLQEDYEEYDVIIGKIANDATNATLNLYLSGVFGECDSNRAADIAMQLLLPNRLEEQYCFKTHKSILLLEKIGVEKYEL